MAGSGRSPPKFSAECVGAAIIAGILAWLLAGSVARAGEMQLEPFEIVGDTIPTSLTGKPGDPARGRAIVVSRQMGLCLLCHSGPFPEERLPGSLAPSLAGVGARFSPEQLRLRVVDTSKVNPQTIMPPYYRIGGLTRVAQSYASKPILSAEQIEDVVAFLATLKEP